MNLNEFIAEARFPFSQWIMEGEVKAYLRASRRNIGEQKTFVLDVATVDVEKQHQRQGHFKRFLAEVERVCPFPFIYVECVQYDWLGAFLERNGWTRDARYESDLNYYKQLSK